MLGIAFYGTFEDCERIMLLTRDSFRNHLNWENISQLLPTADEFIWICCWNVFCVCLVLALRLFKARWMKHSFAYNLDRLYAYTNTQIFALFIIIRCFIFFFILFILFSKYFVIFFKFYFQLMQHKGFLAHFAFISIFPVITVKWRADDSLHFVVLYCQQCFQFKTGRWNCAHKWQRALFWTIRQAVGRSVGR